MVKARFPQGFPDQDEPRLVLKKYIENKGLSIDWSSSINVLENSGIIYEKYSNPIPGYNASAYFIYEDTMLIGMGYSMAL
ncbi:MAG: hypothetical protein GX336_06370 [Halanaerobiaceae bacterium]|nr:hypothetical protein [Halanaerobiaceae bacterium]